MIAGLIASTIAFFVAAHFARRYCDQQDIPKGATRNVMIFSVALVISYAVGWLVDHVA